MRAARFVRLLIALGCSTQLLGCPPEQELSIYNNTGQDLVVVVGTDRIPWKSGDAVRFGGDDGMSWESLAWEVGADGVRDPQLSVDEGGKVSVYRLALPGLGEDFLDRSTGLYRRALQMQPDRKLYAVHIGSELPAASPPPQPGGLPLLPESSAS